MSFARHAQRLVLLTAAGVYAAAVVAALFTPAQATDPPTTAAPRARPMGQVVGFALSVHHVDRVGKYTDAIDQIAALGANAVELLTPIYQQDGRSVALTRPPRRCPSDAQLEQILRHARGRGLAVHLMPIVLLAEPRDNEWRGQLKPADWDAWWAAYEQQVVRLAELAQRTGAAMFSIGSELLSTERQTDRWAALAAAVRQVFDGRLVYSTNWDHYHVPDFWPHLDLVGINGYWKLADDPSVEDDALIARWREIRGQVLAFAARVDRPVLLTEIGYPSLPWALADPWNYVAQGDAPVDPRAQVRGYAAFLSAWHDDLKPGGAANPFAGVFFYEWDLWADTHRDTGYGVKGKAAYDLLKAWFDRAKHPPGQSGG